MSIPLHGGTPERSKTYSLIERNQIQKRMEDNFRAFAFLTPAAASETGDDVS